MEKAKKGKNFVPTRAHLAALGVAKFFKNLGDIASKEVKTPGASAGGLVKGGYHTYAHRVNGGKFKQNQRVERRTSRRRKMKTAAR